MKLFTVVGVSNSGKTTTIEAILRELRSRGYSVASAKSINCGRSCALRVDGVCHCSGGHHGGAFSIDTPGSNSSRHREAGSQLVVTRAQAETAVMFQRELPLEDLLPYFAGYDYVILEGDYAADAPRLVTGRGTKDALERVNERTFAVSGRVSGEAGELEGLPVVDAITRSRELVDLIEARVGELPKAAPSFRLTDGEKELALPPALEQLLEQVARELALGGLVPESGRLTLNLRGTRP